MNKTTARTKLPTFVDIHSLTQTPKSPVIAYFTKARWSEFISRQRVLKRSALPLERFQMRYQLAPWANGDVIVYPNPSFLRLECRPRIKVVVQTNPIRLIKVFVGFACKAKHCSTYIEAYVGKIPPGANGIGCDDGHCGGGCREIFVGTSTEGYFTCACSK